MNTTAAINPWRSFYWLCRRECHRVLKLWTQTTLAPVVSLPALHRRLRPLARHRISEVNGFDYEIFIVPGLIAMAMAQAAYSNNASTIYQGRSDRFIDDVLAAPMHAWQMNFGYLVGGAFRALIIGGALAAAAVPITGAPVEHPLLARRRRPPAGHRLRRPGHDRRHLRRVLRPHQLHQQHRDPSPDLPRRRLLLGRPPRPPLGRGLPREPALLRGGRGALRIPRRLGRRVRRSSFAVLAAMALALSCGRSICSQAGGS